ncbi:hypothetical protein ACIRPK_24145 [Kitasatospora sp. NPDC101801]|uniref:hypothetical protein n=1 Tax=Kitasatospora sp. NPDC101801 TaxID=3364103 RepID=UPI003821B371
MYVIESLISAGAVIAAAFIGRQRIQPTDEKEPTGPEAADTKGARPLSSTEGATWRERRRRWWPKNWGCADAVKRRSSR